MRRRRGLHFYRRRKTISAELLKEIFSWLFGVGTAVFLAVVAVYFFGISTNVVGSSMEPGLQNGQRVLINKFIYSLSRPGRGDVVVFLPGGNQNTHYYVKRVVAVPGDRVRIEGGRLYVNGEESTVYSSKIEDAGIAATEFSLEAGEYFCLGDNPESSEDSRSPNIGPVKREYIEGQVWFRLGGVGEGMGFVK